MIKRILQILFLMLAITIPVSAIQTEVITPIVKLDKKQYQIKTYNLSDKNIVMKALLNVLQDEGYIVSTVNPTLGFIYGTKDYNTSDSEVDLSKEFGVTNARMKVNSVKVATIETTANITDLKDTLKLRINFRKKLLNGYGNAQFIDDIDDAQYYKDFYAKLDKAIFLQQQGLW